MKKFKEFSVKTTSFPMADAVISHLKKLGYIGAGYWYRPEDSYVLCDSNGFFGWHQKNGNGLIGLDEFFAITPEDVLIEPKTTACLFIKEQHDLDNCKWVDLSDEQINEITAIMECKS